MKKQMIFIIMASIILVVIGGYFLYQIKIGDCKTNCTDYSIQMVKELQENMYQKITPKQVKEKLEQQEEVIILDVRTQEEFLQGHIPQSKLLPLAELENKIEEVVQNKEQEIIVYCRSGARSKQAAMQLIKKGYTKVKDMGGIMEWTDEIEK